MIYIKFSLWYSKEKISTVKNLIFIKEVYDRCK